MPATKDLIAFLNSNNLNWVFQSKGNRKIEVRGRWTTIDALSPGYQDSETITVSENLYTVWEIEVRMKGMGPVKVIISEVGRRYYVINRTDWKMKKVMETYMHGWDIEVMHRDLKQDGLGHIFLSMQDRIVPPSHIDGKGDPQNIQHQVPWQIPQYP